MACAAASHLARPRDDIILDNQGVVKATSIPRKGVVKDHDYRDHSYHNVTSKNLTVRWTRGHRYVRNTATYCEYLDIKGNNDSDALANMGDNLPMYLPDPRQHDIIVHCQIMPAAAKSLIMQLRRQKQTADVHHVSWVPL